MSRGPFDIIELAIEVLEDRQRPAMAEDLEVAADTLRAHLEAAEARAEAAEAECARLKQTLAWYADAENYYAPPGGGNPVRDDMGNRARGALAARTKEQQA